MKENCPSLKKKISGYKTAWLKNSNKKRHIPLFPTRLSRAGRTDDPVAKYNSFCRSTELIF